jgi:hypothetical protein
LLCLHLADGPRGPGGQSATSLFVGCSSCSCSPFISIRRGFQFSLGEVSDGLRVPSGRSAGAWRIVRVLPADGPLFGVGSGGSVRFNGRSAAPAGQSAARVRTVRGTLPDGLRSHRGQSALPGRTVRQRLPALLLGSIPPSLFLVLPRVLQGIVPKTRG